MKLLVLSNVPGSVDKLVSIVQKSHSVVAKETSMTTDQIVRSVAEEIESGTYDQVVVAAKDPIKTGMLLNKCDQVQAAVCGSVEDVEQARESGANAIVIRDTDSGELYGIVSKIVESGMTHTIRSSIKAPSLSILKKKAPGRQWPSFHKDKPTQPEPQEEENVVTEDYADEELEEVSSKRKGIIGKIKNALGIL